MELSAILPIAGMGGEQSRCLNDDFAAQTPSGDTVFNKPVADTTVFTTPTGTIIASYLFDPTQEFGNRNVLASISTDFMSDLRDSLTKYLLDAKDIAPKEKTYEETLWENIISSVPKEALAKHVFSDAKQLKEYTELVTKSVQASYTEEVAMTSALKEKKFSFAFEVAIDHYPSKDIAKTEKQGVLTFHLCAQGAESSAAATTSTAKQDKGPGKSASKAAKAEKKEDTASGDGQESKSKKRKHTAIEVSRAKRGKEAREELLKELGLSEVYASTACTVSEKKFPVTATQFFDSLGRWFSASVSNRAAKLEKQRANAMYH
mmetsp:Transcript_47511/g.93442  ORF Transcript_47511/g.93442 Transcript_47511/m.93442 type:complete len:319 (+) Transcript_47511:60-1016(+)